MLVQSAQVEQQAVAPDPDRVNNSWLVKECLGGLAGWWSCFHRATRGACGDLSYRFNGNPLQAVLLLDQDSWYLPCDLFAKEE